MKFYSAFSRNYDRIFPLKEKKLNLLAETFADLQEERKVKKDEKDEKNYNKQVKLLDVGCGTGSYALALAERGYQVTGIDLDPEMIGMAREKNNNINKEDNKKFSVEFQEMGCLILKGVLLPAALMECILSVMCWFILITGSRLPIFLRWLPNSCGRRERFLSR